LQKLQKGKKPGEKREISKKEIVRTRLLPSWKNIQMSAKMLVTYSI